MNHPNRTTLLVLKEKRQAVSNSVGILQARRLALVREFLASSAPFLESREALQAGYRRALLELQLALGAEGEGACAALAATEPERLTVTITPRSVMGLAYRDVAVPEDPRRALEERSYDWRRTTPRLEEAIDRFESLVAEMLAVATVESRLKRLGEEILRVTRRMRVLEERVLPRLRTEIRAIGQYIAEREREAHHRLKRFKDRREVRGATGSHP